MTININHLLPEAISDETAYYLVNFFMNLTAELESTYYAQIRRHINNNMPPNLPDILKDTLDEETPF